MLYIIHMYNMYACYIYVIPYIRMIYMHTTYALLYHTHISNVYILHICTSYHTCKSYTCILHVLDIIYLYHMYTDYI